MDWRDDRFKPSKQQYKEFEEDLSKEPGQKTVESGLVISLAMLFLMPITALLIALALGHLGEGIQIGGVIRGLLWSAAAGFSMFQAYRGLIAREVRIFPKSRIRSETAYVGGKASERVTGRAAVVVGGLFLVAGLVCLAAAVRALAASV